VPEFKVTTLREFSSDVDDSELVQLASEHGGEQCLIEAGAGSKDQVFKFVDRRDAAAFIREGKEAFVEVEFSDRPRRSDPQKSLL